MPEQEAVVEGAQDNTVNAETKEETPEAKEESLLSAAKAEEEKAEEPKTEEEKKEEEKPKTPEEYQDFTVPEGVEVSEELMAGFKGLAKEIGLTQEQAQKLVDLQTQGIVAQKKQFDEAFDAETKRWEEDSKAAFGAKFAEEMRHAARLRDEFVKADPEAGKDLVEFLDKTRVGSYPALVKFFVYYGKRLSEDKFETGKPATSTKNAAQILFGTVD
jgi:hypothetical protein